LLNIKYLKYFLYDIDCISKVIKFGCFCFYTFVFSLKNDDKDDTVLTLVVCHFNLPFQTQTFTSIQVKSIIITCSVQGNVNTSQKHLSEKQSLGKAVDLAGKGTASDLIASAVFSPYSFSHPPPCHPRMLPGSEELR